MATALQFGFFAYLTVCLCGVDGAPRVITDALPKIEVSGRQILVNGSVFHMKGACWNPVPKGGQHPQDLDFLGFYEGDIELMKELGVNVVRTYEPILSETILDALWAAGIMVIVPAYNWAGDTVANIVPARVNDVTKNHPAVLLWEVGNEWNYNMFYWSEGEHGNESGLNFAESLQRASEAVTLIKELDPTRPVATNYGEFPTAETLEALAHVDIWALNLYRGKDFNDTFEHWSRLSDKPMYVGEYGCDAYNSLINSTDFEEQAVCTEELTQQLMTNSVKGNPVHGVTSGGVIFELADEWWKVDASRGGNVSEHDNGGIAPGGGPWPDLTFNEEWWGLVDIDRTEKRPAYLKYAAIGLPEDPPAKENGPRTMAIIAVAILGVVALAVWMSSASAGTGSSGVELGSPKVEPAV